MCPVCLTNAALIAAGAMSSGGLTSLAMSKFYKRKKQTEPEKDKMKLKEWNAKRERAK